MWEPVKLAYLAGIIDGEGCISLRCRIIDDLSPKWDIRVYVVSTDKILIDWLQSNFGGLTYSRNSKKNPHWKTKHEWIISKKQIVPVMHAILPHLVIKKEHCELAIKFRDTFDRKTSRLIPKDLSLIRHDCFKRMKKLNHRGSD
jgi:hypothetical protein